MIRVCTIASAGSSDQMRSKAEGWRELIRGFAVTGGNPNRPGNIAECVLQLLYHRSWSKPPILTVIGQEPKWPVYYYVHAQTQLSRARKYTVVAILQTAGRPFGFSPMTEPSHTSEKS
jgi:hypothetical protein